MLRLMPREGATVEGAVHESFISPYPQDTLEGKLYHYTYDNGINSLRSLISIRRQQLTNTRHKGSLVVF